MSLPGAPHPAQSAATQQLYTLPNGMAVACGNGRIADFMHNEVFLQQVYRRHGVTIGDNACVVDAGANIGLFSIFASQSARNVRVYAFEPIPRTFKQLQLNVLTHAVGVRAFECGVSDADKVVTFTAYPQMSVISGCHIDQDIDQRMRDAMTTQIAGMGMPRFFARRYVKEAMQSRQVECRVARLSTIIAEQRLERIDLLKIDVECSEVEALRGISDEHWPRIRQLIVETHDEALLNEVTGVLRAKGYSTVVEPDPGLESVSLVYALPHA